MKQLNVCLIIFIALFASTSKAFQFSSLKEVQDLKSTIFGSNLIETIALTFQSEDKTGSAKEVLAMLEELRSQLENDQAADTQTFETKQAEFDAHIEKLTEEIDELTEQIEFLISEIERLTGLITQADLNIESFNTRIENLKALLVEMQIANVNDNRYYNQRISQLQSVYNAFTLIIERLEALTGSVSSVDVPTHVSLTDAEKRDLEWRNQNPDVANRLDEVVVKSFLQVESETNESAKLALELSKQYTNFIENTMNADQGALLKLVTLLTSFQEETLATKTATEKHLEDINAQYNVLKEETEAELKLNEEALARQTENRNKYIAERTLRTEEKESKERRRELLTNERTLNEELRANLKSTYEREKLERAAELEIVKRLIKIVENRLVNKSF